MFSSLSAATAFGSSLLLIAVGRPVGPPPGSCRSNRYEGAHVAERWFLAIPARVETDNDAWKRRTWTTEFLCGLCRI